MSLLKDFNNSPLNQDKVQSLKHLCPYVLPPASLFSTVYFYFTSFVGQYLLLSVCPSVHIVLSFWRFPLHQYHHNLVTVLVCLTSGKLNIVKEQINA